MTFENALKKIKTKFEEVNAEKLADMAVQVTLTDEDCGGTFYFKAENGSLQVEGYDYRDNDAVIDIERKTLMDILAGKSTLDDAIEKGRATAKGDFARLDTLKDAIAKYKAPAKKKAVKEPAVKENVAALTKKCKVKTATVSAEKNEVKTEAKKPEKKTAAKKKKA